jgi:hypothetical protein
MLSVVSRQSSGIAHPSTTETSASRRELDLRVAPAELRECEAGDREDDDENEQLLHDRILSTPPGTAG